MNCCFYALVFIVFYAIGENSNIFHIIAIDTFLLVITLIAMLGSADEEDEDVALQGQRRGQRSGLPDSQK